MADFFDAKISDDEYLRVDGSLGQGTSKIGKSQSSTYFQLSMQCLRQMWHSLIMGKVIGSFRSLTRYSNLKSNMQMLL